MKGKIGILVICFMFFLSGCGGEVETNGTTQQETETKTDQGTEKTENKGITEAEKEYHQNAIVYINKILEEVPQVSSILNAETKGDNWIEDVKVLANDIIDNGKQLQELEYTEETKTIGDLTQLFGYAITSSYENLLEGIEPLNQEKLEDWQMDLKQAISYYSELNFYANNGIIISQQMMADTQKILGKTVCESSGLASSGNNDWYIILNQTMFDDKDVLRNQCLLYVYDIMKLYSEKKEYGYLNLIIQINADVIDSSGQEKEITLMGVNLTSATMAQLDVQNISWENIPEIADSYRYVYD